MTVCSFLFGLYSYPKTGVGWGGGRVFEEQRYKGNSNCPTASNKGTCMYYTQQLIILLRNQTT